MQTHHKIMMFYSIHYTFVWHNNIYFDGSIIIIYSQSGFCTGPYVSKDGNYLLMICSLQYRTLSHCMYWFPLHIKLPVTDLYSVESNDKTQLNKTLLLYNKRTLNKMYRFINNPCNYICIAGLGLLSITSFCCFFPVGLTHSLC